VARKYYQTHVHVQLRQLYGYP